ncbi:hypothetical protein NIES4072_44730 [Nostoc commune NIES-4072]|uniref:Restriction endonuclease type IV Mrr domain-containing protein n=1 Tax=Nostoc commune NIES-4072 TaxID=2005467 RepID=A0A2R5FY65_NOSCO|nr:restriction endonuclease [Nostoc commune]BBD68215.1 hypothetical protein NIES4070_46100 [Nostoc commune HK-02]GBG20791.1 hypothetical protein NIES4072_44730 [Nostoc commune NIES-4072]
MDGTQIRVLVLGYTNASSYAKQELGRCFAVHLGLTPGPRGSDDGIDGVGFIETRKIYFQCKLSKNKLKVEEAERFYANLLFHSIDIAVMLAGVGYTSGFESKLLKFPDIHKFKIHLLTLEDLFEETSSFKEALKDMPLLQDLVGEM